MVHGARPAAKFGDVCARQCAESAATLNLPALAGGAGDVHRDGGMRVELHRLVAAAGLALLLQVLEQLREVLAQLREAGPLHPNFYQQR